MQVPEYDLIIIGSGPAGMAAAVTSRGQGLKVLVLDEQPTAGGQIYRNIEHLELHRNPEFKKLGRDYSEASGLVKRFKNCGADYLSGMTVWQIEKELVVRVVHNSPGQDKKSPLSFKAKKILIAVGAMERPMPIPGWTLPGVMACTAVDVLYKSAGIVPKGTVVLAGAGPLLLLIATRLLDAGVKISALLNTNPQNALLKALPHLPSALRTPEYLVKGAGMLLKLRTSGVPIHFGIRSIEAQGKENLNRVRFVSSKGTQTVDADLLLLHQGVVPNVQITRLLGCEHQWYESQRYWEPVLDEWGNTSVPGIAVAGDCGRVSGSKVSELSGHIAALETARALGALSESKRDEQASSIRAELKKQQASRPFLDTLFEPQKSWIVPEDEATMVCRCEEVDVGEIRNTVRLGAHSPDRVKAMIRSGMGFCQGRMCALTLSEIIADELKISPADVGYLRVRSPIKPVTLGQLVSSE
ncbi:MAG: FAD-dependent oxidoreductase [SAR324 cluster bacterium]|nr:FAD-dependent oxidoreductase [SAR324 cluster bacterium]